MSLALEKYRVDDLILDAGAVRLVFLLESPYNDEVIHGHPLAGSSGRSMAKFFVRNVTCFAGWNPSVPFGCQIRSRMETRIALANCSNYPLDRSVYCPVDYADFCDRIDGWDLLRKSPGAVRRRNADHCLLDADIVADLSGRLRQFPKTALIVPCGDVARSFLEKCRVSGLCVFHHKVPHPSRNLWFSDRHFTDRAEFIRTVSELLA